MIKNYIKIAWRNLTRNSAHAFINIFGLSVGLACSLLIMLWVQDELSIDAFHANTSQLYQVYERTTNEGKTDAGYITQGMLAEELKKNVPEIASASPLEQNQPHTFRVDRNVIKMDGTFAGVDFFKMFSYTLLQGSKANALNTPNGIAISNKMAGILFGSAEKAFGKTLIYDNRTNLIVTGVFANVPANSSVKFDFVRNWKDYAADNAWVSNWNSASPATYVQLHTNADADFVAAKVKNFLDTYLPKEKSTKTEVMLQPYAEKYLNSTFKDGYTDGGRISYLYLFGVIGIFILLIACINFMNLTTARSIKRAREVGIRKVIGARRAALAVQFICEAILLTFLSMLIAIIMVAIVLPAFNRLTEKELFLHIEQPVFWLTIVISLLITGLLAGSYPAFFLSSLNPVKVLKGKFTFTWGAVLFRKGLVVFQFSLATILIVGTIVAYRQMQFIKEKNLGYTRNNLVYIPLEGDLLKKYQLFKDDALKMPGVMSVSKMRGGATVIDHAIGDIRWEGKQPRLDVNISDAVVGYDFVKTMGLQLKEGRDFSPNFADSVSYLVNEAAANKFGYKNAVGKPLWRSDKKGVIIGVLKDFHFNTMYNAIEPMVIRLADNQKWGTILVRVKNDDIAQTLAGLEKLSKQFNPDFTFSYQFADQEYGRLYSSEQSVSKLSGYFAALAIFISCLGLLALAMLVADQRIKEIGIRKVLGAGVVSLVTLLSSEFLLLIMIALLIASPIAWLVVNIWLQKFAYHINFNWQIIALSALMVITVAVLTISFQAIKAALANPVKSLRSE